jgi:hypothetical protein
LHFVMGQWVRVDENEEMGKSWSDRIWPTLKRIYTEDRGLLEGAIRFSQGEGIGQAIEKIECRIPMGGHGANEKTGVVSVIQSKNENLQRIARASIRPMLSMDEGDWTSTASLQKMAHAAQGNRRERSKMASGSIKGEGRD